MRSSEEEEKLLWEPRRSEPSLEAGAAGAGCSEGPAATESPRTKAVPAANGDRERGHLRPKRGWGQGWRQGREVSPEVAGRHSAPGPVNTHAVYHIF